VALGLKTRDEAVRARCAAIKLERLYNAYRATSRAHAMVLTRISLELERHERNPERRLRKQQRLLSEMSLSRQSDLVFRDRAEQIRRRIDELVDWEAP
jgi:hypothetical protein